MRYLLIIISIVTTCLFAACKKTATTGPTDQPDNTDTIIEDTKWQIVPIIKTYYGGAEWLTKDAANKLTLEKIAFSNDHGEVFKATVTGKAKGEWINTDKAKIENLGDYTYEVTFANCVNLDATAADTAIKANKVHYKVRLAVPSEKVMYIYYAFMDGSISLNCNKGFNEPIDINKFLSLSVCNTLAVTAN